MNISAAINLFLDRYIPTTRKTYARDLAVMVEIVGPARDLEEVSTVTMLEYAQAIRRRDYAPATTRKHFKTVKAFFNWCVTVELLDKSPASHTLNAPRLPKLIPRNKAMTDAEYKQLLSYVQWFPRDHALVLFLGDTGARAGGAAGLKWDDVNMETNRATVTEKGSKTRPVFFGDDCKRALRQWLIRQNPHKGRYVFSQDGSRISNRAISQRIRRACLACGIRSLGSHSLRHRKGYQLSDDKTPPQIAAMGMGHENVETTLNSYYPADYARVEEAFKRLHTNADSTVIPFKSEEKSG